MNVSLRISGTKEVIKTLDRINRQSEGDIGKIVKANAQEASRAAKSDPATPKDTGALIRSISVRKKQPMLYELGANVTYAAYHEFGTGRFAAAIVPTLPREVQAVAKRYKGKGVRQVNIRAGLMIYRSLVRQMPILIKDIKNYLNTYT